MSQKQHQQLVVIGNGMAGVRTVEELLKLTPDKYQISIFGSEAYGNYNRIMLSPVLANQQSVSDIMLNDLDWYQAQNITLHRSETVIDIDRANKTVTSNLGTAVKYDKLLIATGSNPFLLPLPGAELDNVISYRDIDDVNRMIELSKTHKHAVVIGGGLLGLEAAYGLVQRGMDVTVVHVVDNLMERQLDAMASGMLKATLEAHGIRFLMSHFTEAFIGVDAVEKIRFTNGDEYPADLVIMAVGVRPNINLAQQAGLACERAILVDDTLNTSDADIFAVGECVQHRNTVYGLVAPLFEQAKVCANHLSGNSDTFYGGTELMTKLKISGINLFSAGNFNCDEPSQPLVYTDPSKAIYKKLVITENHLVGAVLYGDTSDSAWYFDLIKHQTDIGHIRDNLIFGEHFCEDADSLATKVA